MSKIQSAKSRKCRSYGVNLWGNPGDAFQKKPYYPGQHKTARRYGSDFGRQSLKVKKLKAYYIMGEKQLRRLARIAAASLENSVKKLSGLLESMIYVVAYRAGFAPTIFLARQLASHGHLLVNGKKVTIKSLKLKAGDVLSLAETARSIPAVKNFIESGGRKVPDYIEVSMSSFSATFKRAPSSETEIPFESEIAVASAVEYYMR